MRHNLQVEWSLTNNQANKKVKLLKRNPKACVTNNNEKFVQQTIVFNMLFNNNENK